MVDVAKERDVREILAVDAHGPSRVFANKWLGVELIEAIAHPIAELIEQGVQRRIFEVEVLHIEDFEIEGLLFVRRARLILLERGLIRDRLGGVGEPLLELFL